MRKNPSPLHGAAAGVTFCCLLFSGPLSSKNAFRKMKPSRGHFGQRDRPNPARSSGGGTGEACRFVAVGLEASANAPYQRGEHARTFIATRMGSARSTSRTGGQISRAKGVVLPDYESGIGLPSRVEFIPWMEPHQDCAAGPRTAYERAVRRRPK